MQRKMYINQYEKIVFHNVSFFLYSVIYLDCRTINNLCND